LSSAAYGSADRPLFRKSKKMAKFPRRAIGDFQPPAETITRDRLVPKTVGSFLLVRGRGIRRPLAGVAAACFAAIAVSVALAPLLTPPAAGQEPGCSREAFESVVGQSAAALRELTGKNRPLFQARLRALKDKRGWAHDQFLKEAAPIVQDDRTAAYDKTSSELLADIERMGAEGSAAPTPDCAALARLRNRMEALVEAQREKWAYIIEKVERELSR